ncbi:beta-N-acetylhexosaminidase [Alloyangia pacifica]|uniref:beta-N-acetylhexosaminidase n=1 Tax=Alloyangia pacifica TaxID=311180 RepID=A0A1I6PVM2_9RHOB|nr:beta-N-acetylhexosaminidase [Alloyangia pacifica]SDG36292.1 beta-N-acetylhexosaminidase [Alloyangia pacifica]SFS44075.1 beta-N-acetylhexosaminidase [Alloyangia pacifica]
MSRFGATILAPLGLTLSAEEKRFFAEANPFGFILFARNVESAEQLRALTSDLRAAVGWHAPVFVDQEGGRVQRLRAPLATEFLPPLDEVALAGPDAARAMELRFRIIAAELLAVGIDGDCAPMLDVARPGTHAFLRNRCYGESVETVVAMGKAVVKGLTEGGVLPVMKHLPGHGLAQLDSHKDLPRVSAPRDELEAIDFAAFRPFADLPLAMTAHLVYEGLNTRPATVDPEMVALIRDNIGFMGLLMSDDLSMEALSGSIGERAGATIAAGCDVALHCNGKMEDMVPVVEAAGVMSEAAQARAEAALATRTIPAEIDITALRAEHEALLAGHR